MRVSVVDFYSTAHLEFSSEMRRPSEAQGPGADSGAWESQNVESDEAKYIESLIIKLRGRLHEAGWPA